MKTNSTLLALFILMIFSCSKNTENSSTGSSYVEPKEIGDITKLYPQDEALSEKYQRSCYMCHVNKDAMAPLVGSADWQKLLSEKGMEGLLKSVANGYKNMPAKGQCLDCTEEDYKAMIEFMINPK